MCIMFVQMYVYHLKCIYQSLYNYVYVCAYMYIHIVLYVCVQYCYNSQGGRKNRPGVVVDILEHPLDQGKVYIH